MSIKRRDFVAGLSVTAGLSSMATPLFGGTSPKSPYYPPALTGLRGSHAGSFELAHALALGGKDIAKPSASDEAPYDLVVVGAGISGLASAYYARQQLGPAARILILDNHDDFGGHAKRNEFTVGGKTLIGYGGSQSIDTPSSYSPEARQLLRDLGINVERFYQYYDRDFVQRNQLGSQWFFDAKHYGTNRMTANPLGSGWLGIPAPEDISPAVTNMPISPESQQALRRLLTDREDPLPHLPRDDKITYLRKKSYEDFLRDDLSMPDEVVLLLRNRALGLWAVGYDALSALSAARSGEPGTRHLGIDDYLFGEHGEEPYIFHFPDGNAAIARLLVCKLIPPFAAGNDMDNIVTAAADYSQLDRESQATRIRLNATALKVEHTAEDKTRVDVVYAVDGELKLVRAKRVIMACYNAIIPHLCPELPTDQAEAMGYPEKAPLVYANIALKNWRAFKQARLYHFHAVRDFWTYGSLDFPVSMGNYAFSDNPDEPIVLHAVHVPTAPGHNAREQYRLGRQQLLSMRFDDYEGHLRRQLSAMLTGTDFDFDRDVAAITVNRWPHGYAYEYIDLIDPPDWGPENGPHVVARKRFGNIAIANSDSSAYAYVNGAIDAAWRAANELYSGQ